VPYPWLFRRIDAAANFKIERLSGSLHYGFDRLGSDRPSVDGPDIWEETDKVEIKILYKKPMAATWPLLCGRHVGGRNVR